jgi:predicted RNase H-like HicB family nuclease
MAMRLTVRIYKGEKYYIARVPELGVTTQGKTRKEAKKNLRQAVQLHLESLINLIKRGNVRIEKGHLLPAKR